MYNLQVSFEWDPPNNAASSNTNDMGLDKVVAGD